MTKILLLGATGRTGKELVPLALEKGHSLRCLVRDSSKMPVKDQRLEVLQGNPGDKNLLSSAMEGADAVISVLNISRRNDFPWAALRTNKNFLSDVIGKVTEIATQQSVKRLIVCSAWGVADTRPHLPGWFRWLIDNSNIGVAYRDHERQEELVKQSNLDWTIVRPVGLTNSSKNEEMIISFDNQPKPTFTISRRSLASFMLEVLHKPEFIGKTPTISAK